MQIRITPTCLSIHDLPTILDFAWENKVSVESCNFLMQPEILRMSVLPMKIRKTIADSFIKWLQEHQTSADHKILNTRDQNNSHQQIVQDLQSYIKYLNEAHDESYRLPELIAYLKKLENRRKNSILTFLPQYENLFRSAGY